MPSLKSGNEDGMLLMTVTYTHLLGFSSLPPLSLACMALSKGNIAAARLP